MRVRAVAVVTFAVTRGFSIIIHDEKRIEENGDGLQDQGQDGELQPHVGGVRRHVLSSDASSLLWTGQEPQGGFKLVAGSRTTNHKIERKSPPPPGHSLPPLPFCSCLHRDTRSKTRGVTYCKARVRFNRMLVLQC